MSGLNVKQQEAVEYLEGPALIIAGPGTGKTTVLTNKIAYILKSTDSKPKEILALTYTNAGVSAMKEKLLKLIGTDAHKVGIYTIHGFCNYVINQYPEHFTELAERKQATDFELYQLIMEIIDTSMLDKFSSIKAKYYNLGNILSTISNLKRENITFEALEKAIKREKDILADIPKESKRSGDGLTGKYKDQLHFIEKLEELLLIYRKYEELMTIKQLYDYDDMISFVLRALEENSDLKSLLQESFQYFLIDEYQDTNSIQNRIIFNLADYWGDKANIFVVGDDDQSIYRFQGASTINMREFLQKYQNARVITLTENYRSTKIILDASYELISNNTSGIAKMLNISKHLNASGKYGSINRKITKVSFADNIAENIYICEKIKKLQRKKVDLNEVAIIVRNNRDMDDIVDTLQRFKLPYVRRAGDNVLENNFIVQLINLLKVIAEAENRPNDDALLFEVIRYSFFKLDNLSILKICRHATENRINLWDLVSVDNCNEELLKLNIQQDKLNSIMNFFTSIARWNQISHIEPLAKLVEIVINESGFLEFILNTKSKYENINALNSFFVDIKNLNYNKPSITLTEFLRFIKLMSEHRLPLKINELGMVKSGVQVSTAHGSKGLEFEYVFIPKMYDSNWGNTRERSMIKLPSYLYSNSEDQDNYDKLEEERRIFYVALTRAKKKVYLTFSKTLHSEFGNTSEKVESPFWFEISNKYTVEPKVKSFEITDSLAKTLLGRVEQDSLYVNSTGDEEYLRNILSKFQLSATELNTFLEDPYLFFEHTIIRTPSVMEPTLVNGSAWHDALKRIYAEFQRSGRMKSFIEFKRYYTTFVNKAILSDIEKEKLIKKADECLKLYYDKTLSKTTVVPLFLEKNISNVHMRGALLMGTIDRVDYIDSKKKFIKLIEYKTGDSISENELNGVTTTKTRDGSLPKGLKYRNQLMFYKLLVDLDPYFSSLGAEATYGEIDFVEHNTVRAFEYSKEQLEEFKQLVIEVWQKIMRLEFPREPSQ